MAQVRKGQRAKLGAVWISTSNPRYRLHGVRVHMTLSAARRHLAAGNLLHVGANDWYLAAAGSVTAVLKVRNGMVGEVGIAPRRFTLTVQQQRAFMRSSS
jgi:hypothetical protein